MVEGLDGAHRRGGLDLDLDDVNVPEDPVRGAGAVGDVVGHGVAPGREAAVGPEEVAVAGAELDVGALPHGLPLEGGVEAAGEGLDHLAPGHAEEEGLVGGGEVLAVAALEAEDGVGVEDELDGPPGAGGGPVAVLGDGLLVLLRHQVLVVAAPEAHRPGVAEELHARQEAVAGAGDLVEEQGRGRRD